MHLFWWVKREDSKKLASAWKRISKEETKEAKDKLRLYQLGRQLARLHTADANGITYFDADLVDLIRAGCEMSSSEVAREKAKALEANRYRKWKAKRRKPMWEKFHAVVLTYKRTKGIE